MKKNMVQFQAGYSLSALFKDYGTEEKCAQALFSWKWPSGFVCPECSSERFCTLKSRKHVYQCNHCHYQTSLTSGTIFENTKLPLTQWFMAIHLITQSKTGVSALELKRQLGVSYNTAWSVKQKIMQVMMERDDRKQLSGTIQVDDVYWGGEHRGGSRGRGSENKTPFVVAVSTTDDGHPVAMNMSVLKGFKLTEIASWAKQHLKEGSHVVSDGLSCFTAVTQAGCIHSRHVTGGGATSMGKEEFTWVNTMIGNIKMAMIGTYHALKATYLKRYLAEFCYRFNRRFNLEEMLPRFSYVAVRTPAISNRLLKVAVTYG